MASESHEANETGKTNGPGSGGGVRIGHEERQQAADDLAEHFAQGRLEQAEFEERTGAAWQAKTVADLKPLFFDLPGGSLNGFLTSQAASGTERSSRAPATRDGDARGEAVPTGEKNESKGISKALTILMGIFPILMVIAFFLLRAVGVDQAWLVFLLIPIFYITTGVLISGDDEDEDDKYDDDDDDGRLDR